MFTVNEHAAVVNMLEAVASALGERGVHVSDVRLGAAGADAALTLTWRGQRREYPAQVKESWNRASVARAAADASPVALLLVGRHLPAPLAAQCRALGLHFADASGNVFLDWGDLVLDVEGRRGPGAAPSRPPGPLRAFQPSGLRVLFALLCRPDLVGAPFRELADTAGVALGTVHRVMKELETEGYVEDAQRERLLHRTRALLDRWVEAYVLSLEPRLTLGRFETDDLHEWLRVRVPVEEHGAQWGGETAAALLTRHLRPATAVVYVHDLPRDLMRSYRLRPAPSGEIVLRKRFWNFSGDEAAVPSVLVYADLIASGDPRQIETAQILRSRNEDLRRLDAR